MNRPRILAVNDAPEVLNLLTKILTAQGYEVLAARGGDEAIAAFDKAGGAIDLLLTDVVMPGMNGAELAEKLIVAAPGIPVLLISGQCEESVIGERLSGNRFRFLAKPFLPQALADAVREALTPPESRRKSATPYTDSSEKSA